MEWIELKRSNPVQLHEPMILFLSYPGFDLGAESGPVHSGLIRVGLILYEILTIFAEHGNKIEM